MKSVFTLVGALAFGLGVTGAAQAQDPVKIALIHGMSGSALEAFSKQSQTGFELGIEYATGGTNEIKLPLACAVGSGMTFCQERHLRAHPAGSKTPAGTQRCVGRERGSSTRLFRANQLREILSQGGPA